MSIGYGKVILFGEHFVVHGCPAIAVGISNYSEVTLEKAETNQIVADNRPLNKDLSVAGITAVLNSMNIKDKYKVIMGGNLPHYGGLGSSAAFCVALVKTIAKEREITLSDEQINKHAFDGEKAFHGNPSGIDNTVATYRGAVFFKKYPKENLIERIKIGRPLDLVISFTGKIGVTPKMLAEVAKYKLDMPTKFSQLMDEASEIVNSGKHAIERGKYKDLGKLMTENHQLLNEVGVSLEENNQIVDLALKEGALGAKLTGGGGGGHCIALAENKVSADKIIIKLKEKGFQSFYSKVV